MATSNVETDARKNAAAGLPLPANSPLYQVRSEDETRSMQTILAPGALVRIRASHGMGKTSLIHQLLDHAARADCKTAYLSLRDIDLNTSADLDSFLQAFCLEVAQALHIPDQLDEYWDDFFGSTICCKSYFEEYLLPEISSPLVLALDDVDRVFSLQGLADDFFGLLRAWHEDAKIRDLWKRLKLIVAHSTDLYVPQNINKSPFNVGLPIELSPFGVEQVRTCLQQWQLTLAEPDLATLNEFVGGRPHLVQLACWTLSHNGGSLAAMQQAALTVDSPFSPLLKRLQTTLEQRPSLAKTLAAVIAGQPTTGLKSQELYHLDSLGILTVANQEAHLSCNLYAQWFLNR
jgi:hypothetical protein